MGAYRAPGGLPPLLAGTFGGLLATWVTFAPCFLWIFLGAPFIERLRGNASLSGALSAITAAVVGVVANLAVWFLIHTLFHDVHPFRAGLFSFDMPSLASIEPLALALSVATILATFVLKAGMVTVLGGAAAAGLALYLAGMIG
jgi:chromate transporter